MKKIKNFLVLTISIIATIMLIEYIASFFVPAWPKRDLRNNSPAAEIEDEIPSNVSPIFNFNSWGMRDYQRKIEKDLNKTRYLFIGDSFLEGGFEDTFLSYEVNKKFSLNISSNKEFINLGVSGTSPIDYYFRLKEVGLKLNPDYVFLFFFSGNDFLSQNEKFSEQMLSSFGKISSESAKPSILRTFTPRLNYLLNSALKNLEFSNSNKIIPNELVLIGKSLQKNYPDFIPFLAEHLKNNYFQKYSIENLNKILLQGNKDFYDIYKLKEGSNEFLQGWMLNNMIQWEMNSSYIKSLDEALKENDEEGLKSTLSWVEKTFELSKNKGIPFVLFLIPPASVDKEFSNYWKPFPKYYSWNLICEARHIKFINYLKEKKIPYVDLRDFLNNDTNTYRKSDSHWNVKGHKLVAKVIIDQILKLDKK